MTEVSKFKIRNSCLTVVQANSDVRTVTSMSFTDWSHFLMIMRNGIKIITHYTPFAPLAQCFRYGARPCSSARRTPWTTEEREMHGARHKSCSVPQTSFLLRIFFAVDEKRRAACRKSAEGQGSEWALFLLAVQLHRFFLADSCCCEGEVFPKVVFCRVRSSLHMRGIFPGVIRNRHFRLQ